MPVESEKSTKLSVGPSRFAPTIHCMLPVAVIVHFKGAKPDAPSSDVVAGSQSVTALGLFDDLSTHNIFGP